jgi:energy-coupling factor transporter ATP-binding protein EcfA2
MKVGLQLDERFVLTIIKARQLKYAYPNAKRPAINGVSFDIEKGEFAILTGPSGCGKTTLCRCFNGLIPHFYQGKLEGGIQVVGLSVPDHPIHELSRQVGLVFQNPENQLFALSVEKDIAFGLENLGVPRERMQKEVDWALETAGICKIRDRAPHELSGGQQQRVAIASVLAMRPQIIVLDEPTSFLDPLGAKTIFEVLDDLNRSLGITVILVEHRLDLAAKYADHVIIMDKGKIVLDGEPREVLSSQKARLLGVGVPKAIRLYQILEGENSSDRVQVPLTPEEMMDFLRGVLKK